MTEPSTEVDTTPAPFMVGTYAIFKKPDGGVHLALREQGGEEHHIELPAFMVEMAASGEGISPMALVKAAMSQGKRRRRGAVPDAAAGNS
jgi:hypothetical protein